MKKQSGFVLSGTIITIIVLAFLALIGISSTSSLGPSPNFAAYGAAKAAMNHLTRTLAIDLGPRGIRANALAVGIVPTESLTTIGGITDDALPSLAKGMSKRKN